RSCLEIAIKYKGAGFDAPSGIYKLTTSATTQVERACYFVKGELPTAAELITGVKTDAIARRYDWENSKISRSCAAIIGAWNTAPTGFYTFVSGNTTYSENNPCAFASKRIANAGEVQTQCNNSASGSSAACQYGWLNNYNRSCDRIIASNTAAASKYYYINSSQTVATNRPCYFVSGRVATAVETITECNRVNATEDISCRYGYDNSYNNTCDNIINYDSSRSGTDNIVTAANSVSTECCACCSFNPALNSEVIVNNTVSTNGSGIRVLGEYNACAGKYLITLKAGAGKYCEIDRNRANGYGGIGTVSVTVPSNTNITFRSADGHGTTGTYVGGIGMGVYLGDTLIMAVGGGVSYCYGGGGYRGGRGGCNYNQSMAFGYSLNTLSLATSSNQNTSTSTTGSGGRYWQGSWFYAWGGSGYCASGYSCSLTAGGNSNWGGGTTSGGNTSVYGYASIKKIAN
ncbi:MAG: hypothetical protein IKD08_01735, partial [Alphaproteobacteria bacterium]|nr:hypothetical protein [Alphaproteobacteria bacterium]